MRSQPGSTGAELMVRTQNLKTGVFTAHRAKSRVSVFLKRGGNMQLHVSVMFTFCGNVKNASLRDPVTFPERKCQVTFPSYLSHQISAVVRFRHVSANGFAVVCYIYQNTNARWFFEQQHFNQ